MSTLNYGSVTWVVLPTKFYLNLLSLMSLITLDLDKASLWIFSTFKIAV